MTERRARLGADIGGTFTDVVLEVGSDRYSVKVLTTHDAPERAIIDGVQQVCAQAEVAPEQIQQVIHGTTLATNALIERNGAKTALITTNGFRDVIEMRTESRFEQYDLNLQLPEPLLPRQCRYTVSERISASGEILIPLLISEVEALVAKLKKARYESVAVGLLHSYVDDSHERLVLRVLQEQMPEAMVSLSSEVSPQMREYERFNTVVANAYIKPMMKSYLSRLIAALGQLGVACPVFLMHSGGGIISLENAAEYPVRLVESGPAGGAVFASHIAARYGADKVLSFDMGGTTAKICLIKDQTPKTSRVFEVARTYRFKKGSGMPISIPVIDMVEIGAGGGSLAQVDAMRQIRVGPESAGSEPGPACYGRGGEQPAVTDADLILGKLDPHEFAGGSISLDAKRAVDALQQGIGRPLELDESMAAYGVAEVVDENMANAARVHAVENGEDLSEYTMIAFGGAAPLHASRLCQKLGIERLLVPVGAGVGSAIGFLRAPFSFEANRSVFMRLHEFDATQATHMFLGLQAEATEFVRTCDADATILCEHSVYMRYAGQGWEIPVALTPEQAAQPTAEVLQHLFEREYEALFARTVDGMEMEITVWSVNATTPAERVEPLQQFAAGSNKQTDAGDTSIAERFIFDAVEQSFVSSAVFPRAQLEPGARISGPAAITEIETTVIIPAGAHAVLQEDGSLDMRFSKGQSDDE